MKDPKNVGDALSRAHKIISQRDEIHIIHTSDLSRKDRELLTTTGWLQEIIKGWYLLTRPDLRPGDSSSWYAAFWDFLYLYLTHFYGDDYCLSAENSLDLHIGTTVIPHQVIVVAPKGRGTPLDLPYETSLLIYASNEALPHDRVKVRRLQVMSLPYAICKVSPTFFQKHPSEVEIALQSMNSDELLRVVIAHNFVRAAGRLIGAYRFLDNKKMVEELTKGLSISGIRFQETNPFSHSKPLLVHAHNKSPYAARIFAMWKRMRIDVIELFPQPPGLPVNKMKYLEQVEEQYSQDAYHSLSIEGYQVNQDLIEKVMNAAWNPESHEEDRLQRDALAARGYYEAFQAVKASLAHILDGATPGKIAQTDLQAWYYKLFAPSVAARIIDQSDLFGYRRHQVYIRNSRHTPLPAHALRDSMDALFQCLIEEENAAVRAVLGHFIFVFIHPYMDGNGRIGRFLMNVMLGSGGYPWTIIHVEHRKHYLDALEQASSEDRIIPFVKFLYSELERSM